MEKRQPYQRHIPYKSYIGIIKHNAIAYFFVKISSSLLFLIQMFSFILITTLKRNLRRKVLDFKSVSIFAIFIVYISIFSLNVNYLHSLDNIYNDDHLVCETVHNDDFFICDTTNSSIDDVSNLSIYDVHQVPPNDFITVFTPIDYVFFNPYVLGCKISSRAPPA
jgi:hypothetical protein